MVVHIGSGQPELQAALAQLPSRARAERLRQLAACNDARWLGPVHVVLAAVEATRGRSR